MGVWGCSFKPGSDDIRDSPALQVAAALHRNGARVTIYDPRPWNAHAKSTPNWIMPVDGRGRGRC